MYVENANRAARTGLITPDNFEPNPKNPIIASFFRNIGHSDQLGSGVHNLFKYSKYYSGKEPELIEGDVFKIIVPLDDEYSFDAQIGKSNPVDKTLISVDRIADKTLSENERKVLKYLKENGVIVSKTVKEITGLSATSSRDLMKKLILKRLVVAVGEKKNREYRLTQK